MGPHHSLSHGRICWSVGILMCLTLFFLPIAGGVIAGAIWQENGFLWEIGQKFPALMKITDYYSNQFGRDFYGRSRDNYGGGYDNYYPGLYGHLDNSGEQRNNNNNMRTKVILPGKL